MLHYPSGFPAALPTLTVPSPLLHFGPPSCCADFHGALSPASQLRKRTLGLVPGCVCAGAAWLWPLQALQAARYAAVCTTLLL